jgi:RHS repeat-associated protein
LFSSPPISYLTGADANGVEDAVFFYHGNHLSSTQMVTNTYGHISQQVLYAPFGEVLSDYNAYWDNENIPDYLFNAKELDEENGMYYYSARYYAPPVFTSRDPLFEKYPFMSPYCYTANNPLKYIDPTGMTLEVPDEQSQKDVKSIVRPRNADRVKFDEKGMASIDFSGLSGKQKDKMLRNDKGLGLINNMIVSDKKMLYETSEKVTLSDKDGNTTTAGPTYMSAHGIINASNYGKDSRDDYTYRPKEGYDGQVAISVSAKFRDENNNDIRNSVLFHELAENYYRTHYGYDYNGNSSNGNMGAHFRAIQREGIYYGNPNPGNVSQKNSNLNRK